MNKKPSDKLLTDSELELMTPLWALGEGTVHQVMEKLPPDRKLAYTSVSTILRILEEKGIVKARKEGRGHIYIPALTKAAYEARSVQHMVDHVFAGTASALVKQLLGTVELDDKELQEIRALLASKGGKK